MGLLAIKIKLMPESPSTNLEEIKEHAKKVIEASEGNNCSFVEEPIAFGLKAVIATFGWPDQKSLDDLEEEIGKSDLVNSVQVISMTKAFG